MKKKIGKERFLLLIILLVFTIFISFLALKLRMGLSPDSHYHLEVSRAYSTAVTRPQNTPDTYQWRDITRIAYLYFWLNGRILNINKGLVNEVLLLRLFNVLYSVGTVYVTYLFSKEIFKNRWKRLLPVFFLTNTLMFVFLSSSINYDNLANLLSVLSIFYFVRFVKSKIDIKYLLLMILFLCIGTLTKYTLLPLALILVLVSIVDIFQKREFLKDIKYGKNIFILIPILFFAILNLELYGTNILRYGGLEPDCNQILTHEQCLQNGVYYRDNVTRQPIEINGIKDIANLILSGERVDPFRYFLKWLPNLTMKIYGIMADNSMYMPEYFWYMFIFVFLIAFILGILNFKKWNMVERYLIVVFLFYIGVLFFMQNYSMYLRFNHYYLALQGRYIFPVISIMYILFSKSFLFLKKRGLRYTILIGIGILFLYSCIPFFLENIPSTWIESGF